MRELEERLGVRLLTRTTRSVSPTEAGERLLHTLAPRFDEIDAEIAALTELRRKPAGKIRITATEYAADTVRRSLPGIADCSVKLCLEPLPLPDTDFIITCAEAVELLDRVSHPNFDRSLSAMVRA